MGGGIHNDAEAQIVKKKDSSTKKKKSSSSKNNTKSSTTRSAGIQESCDDIGAKQAVPPQQSFITEIDDGLKGPGGGDGSGNIIDYKLRRLLRADLLANIFLTIGGLAFVIFFVRDLMKSGRGIVADVLYFVGSSSFLLSGIIQTLIDVLWTRSIPSGRYTTNQCWNLTITTLFLWGVICDIIAFCFWRIGDPDAIRKERITQWVGSHLWFLSAIIVVLTNLKRNDEIEDKIDVLANLCFLLEALMNVVARYVTDLTPDEGETWDAREIKLELVAAVFWTCNALFYLIGGSIRVRKFRQGRYN